VTVYTHYLLLPLMHTHKSMNAAAGFGACGGIHLVQGGPLQSGVGVGCNRRDHGMTSARPAKPRHSRRFDSEADSRIPIPIQQRSRRIETRTATKTDTKVFVQTALQASPSKIIISTQRMETGTRGSEVPLSFC